MAQVARISVLPRQLNMIRNEIIKVSSKTDWGKPYAPPQYMLCLRPTP